MSIRRRVSRGWALVSSGLIDASIVRNYVNWTLPGERRDSFLCYVERSVRGCQAAKGGNAGPRGEGREQERPDG